MKKQVSFLRLSGLSLLAGVVFLLADRSSAGEIKKGAALEVDGGGLVTSLAFSADSRTLVGGEFQTGVAGRVWVWNVATGKRMVTFKGHSGRVTCVAISPDAKTVASGDRSGEIKLFEAATGKETAAFKPDLGGEEFMALAFSADGKTLTFASQLSLRVWDLGTGKKTSFSLASEGEKDESNYEVAVIRPDRKILALGSKAGTVKLWDITTGKETARLKGHKAMVVAMAFSRDGKMLATGSQDGTIRIWKLTNGKEPVILKSVAPVTGLAFTPDGASLASAHKRTQSKIEVKVWDVAGGSEKAVLQGGHSKDVYTVAVSPDGQFLASGGDDEPVVLWHLPPVKKVDK